MASTTESLTAARRTLIACCWGEAHLIPLRNIHKARPSLPQNGSVVAYLCEKQIYGAI